MITSSSTTLSSELLPPEAEPTEVSWFSMSFGTGVGAAEGALVATTMVVERVDVSTVLPASAAAEAIFASNAPELTAVLRVEVIEAARSVLEYSPSSSKYPVALTAISMATETELVRSRRRWPSSTHSVSPKCSCSIPSMLAATAAISVASSTVLSDQGAAATTNQTRTGES